MDDYLHLHLVTRPHRALVGLDKKFSSVRGLKLMLKSIYFEGNRINIPVFDVDGRAQMLARLVREN